MTVTHVTPGKINTVTRARVRAGDTVQTLSLVTRVTPSGRGWSATIRLEEPPICRYRLFAAQKALAAPTRIRRFFTAYNARA
jgi:hypothetical protein